MLQVMNSNSWFPTMFDDFFNNDWMPKMKATAPAVNVKEDANAYTMELAVHQKRILPREHQCRRQS